VIVGLGESQPWLQIGAPYRLTKEEYKKTFKRFLKDVKIQSDNFY
jgi:hypothetical protein